MLNAARSVERLLSVANVLQPVAAESYKALRRRIDEAFKGGHLEENL